MNEQIPSLVWKCFRATVINHADAPSGYGQDGVNGKDACFAAAPAATATSAASTAATAAAAAAAAAHSQPAAPSTSTPEDAIAIIINDLCKQIVQEDAAWGDNRQEPTEALRFKAITAFNNVYKANKLEKAENWLPFDTEHLEWVRSCAWPVLLILFNGQVKEHKVSSNRLFARAAADFDALTSGT